MADDEVDGKEVEGNVYMLEEKINGKATGYYKVGKAVESNFKKRMSDLQTGNVRPLNEKKKVLVQDYTAAERKAQEKLSEYSVDLGGGKEWFKVKNGELETFIAGFEDALKAYQWL